MTEVLWNAILWVRTVILRWLRVLWVCRVSAASVGLGLALFTLAGPARDLFMEIQPYRLYWTAFFAMALAWSLIVDYSARKVLEQQAWGMGADPERRLWALEEARERYRVPAAWMPRILGFTCLGAIWIGISGAAEDLAAAKEALSLPEPRDLLWYLAGATALYLAYVLLFDRLTRAGGDTRPWGDYLRGLVTGRGSSLMVEPSPFWFFQLATPSQKRRRPTTRQDIVSVLLLVSLAVVWIAAIARPWLVELVAPRALFVILMLGLPVSFLAFLSAASHYLRVPIIAGSVLILALLTGSSATFHDLRTLKGRDVARLDLGEAADRWAKQNCGAEPVTEANPCRVRPIILASAGGASRAAFFTASVVGDMLRDEKVDLRHRLFAISGVSGGSVGAVVIRAALDDAGPDGGAPCTRFGRSWFRFNDDPKPEMTWKACLQAITAGDFLSRPFVGLAFRDLFGSPFHLLGMSDRAVLLEEAFQDQYRYLVDAKAGGEGGLGRAIGEAPNGDARWVPLLVLNTTSVVDGRRSIISDLRTYTCKGTTTVPVFPAAVDLLDMLGKPRPNPCGNGSDDMIGPAPTVRLSTGATASARFPVISPPGGIRAPRLQNGQDVQAEIDMVVDGGYFENDGLTSARQLAEALHRVRRDLPRAVIVHVTNEPTSESHGEAEVPPRQPRTPRVYDTAGAPFLALAATRDGHAAEAINAARKSCSVRALVTFQVGSTVTALDNKQDCTLAGHNSEDQARKSAADIKGLSMSWWLSGAVQAYLDRQLCSKRNVMAYDDLMRVSADGGVSQPGDPGGPSRDSSKDCDLGEN